MVSQVSKVVVTEDFDDDRVGVVANDLDVARRHIVVPQSIGMVAGPCIHMACQDEFAATSARSDELSLKPVELLLRF